MKENLEKRLAELSKKAKVNNSKIEVKSQASSSLHIVIKTKAQADLFMKLLKEA